MEKLAALDDGKARTIQHVADAILHHVFQFTGQNPEMDRVALAAYGAELVALGNGLSQRIERGHPKRTLEGELRKQAMMGPGKPQCCRDWRRQREVRGTPGHRTAKRPECRTTGMQSCPTVSRAPARTRKCRGARSGPPERNWSNSATA